MMQTCLTVNASDYTDLLHIPPLRAALSVMWISVGLVMFVGNLLVIGTILVYRAMRTVTNSYILNLAVTDLLVAVIVLPLKGVQLMGPCSLSAAIFNPLGCAVVTFFLMLLVFTSLLTLVVISMERFLAIVYPLRSLAFQSRSRTALFLLLTWALPGAFCLVQAFHPAAVPFHSVSRFGSQRNQHCLDSFTVQGRRAYVLTSFALLFLCPLAVVAFTSCSIVRALVRPAQHLLVAGCPGGGGGGGGGGFGGVSGSAAHARVDSKRKVAKMIVVVTCLYLVSWVPWYTMNLIALFYPDLFNENYGFQMVVLHLIGFANSSCNPIVYYFMSQRFRQCYHRLFVRLLLCRRGGGAANGGLNGGGNIGPGGGGRQLRAGTLNMPILQTASAAATASVATAKRQTRACEAVQLEMHRLQSTGSDGDEGNGAILEDADRF